MSSLIKDDITGNNEFSNANADSLIDAINDNNLRAVANEQAITAIDPNAGATPMFIPQHIYGVVGDTMQIFYDGMVFPYRDSFYFDIICFKSGVNIYKIGEAYRRYWEWTPLLDEIGDYTLQIRIYDGNGNIIQTSNKDEHTVHITEAVQNPSSLIQAVAIGDSLTSANVWDSEMNRRITGTGGTPEGNGFANFNIINEGESGKTWNWFADSTSPFWYVDKLDFEAYRVAKGFATLDVLYCLMTGNGMGSPITDWETWKTPIRTIIDAYLSDFPNGKVVLMETAKISYFGDFSPYGQFGTLGYNDYITKTKNIQGQAIAYDELSKELAYVGKVDHVCTNIQFDADYAFPLTTKQANVRIADTEKYTTGGVHPSTVGYNQIADSAYRHFINNYCQ